MTVIVSARLILREFVESDAEALLALLNDPDWIRFIGDRQVRTLDDARRQIEERYRAQYRQLGFGFWAMTLKPAGPLIGMCGLIKRDELPGVDIGYALLPAFRGQGYVLEATRACRDYAREVLKLDQLLAIVSPDNAASIKVLTALGMQEISRMRLSADADEVAVYRAPL